MCIKSFLPFAALILMAALNACGDKSMKTGAESGSFNDILPNPNKVYADQCYVWLKEMPDFFRERHYLEGGLVWDRHSYQGIYVSDNPKSMFYSRHYVGETVLLFKPDKPGGGMNRGNIIYQYSISQGNDGDNDQIWWWGEAFPPRKPQLSGKDMILPWPAASSLICPSNKNHSNTS